MFVDYRFQNRTSSIPNATKFHSRTLLRLPNLSSAREIVQVWRIVEEKLWAWAVSLPAPTGCARVLHHPSLLSSVAWTSIWRGSVPTSLRCVWPNAPKCSYRTKSWLSGWKERE
ncbi:hypothetical protein M5689_017884 [Euphorbia peplus]|nr:hypothetical protein M5689_017884 [Euphorbia peplus]